ncbi:Outer-arm_dynein gamma [Hexamita inflata]|uniref:Outer-arm dynein gamma n=1 Tax=Hexamita inflata TaxID=28002 RepID=A0AA86T9R0_9EUKA|nr:Outer-arm dynein gamma [Hexamita inflata]
MSTIKDQKSKMILEKAAQAYCVDYSVMENAANTACLGQPLTVFLSPTGANAFCFQFENLANPVIRMYTDLNQLPANQMDVFYCVKLKQGQIMSVDQDLACGMLAKNYLQSLVILLQNVFQPVLENQDLCQKQLSEAQVSTFLNTCKRFVDSLQKCGLIIKDQVKLIVPEDDNIKKIPQNPTQAQINKMLADQPEQVSSIECAVAALCNQIELFLVDQEKVRIEGEDVGPESEQIFWRARMACYNHIQQQMKDIVWINSAMVILKQSGSQVVSRWQKVKQRVQEGTNEAKDNLKYLSTITDILQPLYSNQPGKLTLVIQDLMETIKMTHAMAKYYGSRDNMTTLMVKISNQMIKSCRIWIKTIPKELQVTESEEGQRTKQHIIYDRMPKDILHRIGECITLNQRYQKAYQDVKQKLVQTPQEKQFDFSEEAIFGNFDLFCHRLKKIADIIITKDNFSSLEKTTVSGLQEIIKNQNSAINELKVKPYDALMHRMVTFDEDYDKYKNSIKKQEDDLKNYVDIQFSVEKPQLQDLINIMQQLGEILNRPNLKGHVLQKYKKLLELYFQYIKQVSEFFDNQKEQPPIPAGFTEIGGRIAWAKILYLHINKFMNFFKRVYVKKQEEANMDYAPDADVMYAASMEQQSIVPDGYQRILEEFKSKIKVQKEFNELQEKLNQYIKMCLSKWHQEISEIRMSLQSTVLVEHPKTKQLYVNFDQRITELCHEVKILQTLKIAESEIPEAAKSITLHEINLSKYRDQLVELIKEIEILYKELHEDTRELMQPLLNKLQKRIQPLLHTVCWTSMNLPEYINQVKQTITLIRETNSLTVDILTNRIGVFLKEISQTTFVPLLRRPAPGSQQDGSLSSSKKSNSNDDNESNKDITSHQERQHSIYLEHNSSSVQSYKKYLEKAEPHKQQVVENIYKDSQFIAASVCEIITIIASRYLTKQNDDNAQTLKKLVIQTIQLCFDYSKQTELQSEIEKDNEQRTQRTSSELIQTSVRTFIRKIHQRFITAIFMATERTIRSLIQRVNNLKQNNTHNQQDCPDDLFSCDFELYNEQLRMTPGSDDMKKAFDEILKQILMVPKKIPLWNAKGNYYDNVLHQLSPIVSEKSDDQKLASLKQTLQMTATAIDMAKGRVEPVDLQISAEKKWDFDFKASSVVVMNQLQLDDIDPECSVYSVLGKSKQLLKMTMSVQFSMLQLTNYLQFKLNNFATLSQLWKENMKAAYKQFQAQNPEPLQYLEQIKNYERIIQNVQLIPNLLEAGIVLVRTENIKINLEKLAKQWKEIYAVNLNARARLELQNLTNFMTEVQSQMSLEIKDLQAVRKIMKALSQFRELEANFDMKVYPLEEIYQNLQLYKIQVNRDELEQVEQLRYNLQTLQNKSLQVSSQLHSLQSSFKTDLISSVKAFDVLQKDFCSKWVTDGPQQPGIKPAEANKKLREFQNQFVEIEEKWLTYSTGEDLFGLPVTDYKELTNIKANLKFLDKLYSLYNDVTTTIQGYDDQQWQNLDFDAIAKQVNDDFMTKQMKLPKQMRDWPAYLELDKKIKDFSVVLPLFTGLKRPFIKQRHWEKLFDLTGEESVKKAIPDADGTTLAKLADIQKCHPETKVEDIEEIILGAEKEEKIETNFNKVKDKFKEAKFIFGDFKTRGKLILESSTTSELVTDLEEQQMMLSSLKSNRFNKPFIQEITQWVGFLSTLDETLILWLQVQQNWIYLEAVFASGDIARQLPAEAKRFSNIDKNWLKIMQTAQQNPKCIDLTSRDDTLKSLLPYLLVELEKCQKSLSGYLEQKRNLFPRFYFCSDAVLLEVLGQQSEPTNIQNHLLSIFDSLAKVQFGTGTKKAHILGMFDKTGEKVDLSQAVVAQGNIEDWLNKLILVMQSSLKDIARQAASDLNKPNIKALVEELFRTQPAQITLLCIQIVWTLWCEQYFRNTKDKKMYAETLNKTQQLMKVLIDITRDRQVLGGARTNVETLITIHVHQQDVFNELTRNPEVDKNVKSVNDFDWLKQTRFYWNTDLDTCKIQITDIDFTYQYEYLGINERLVITPLTDRCYITLAQAIGLYLGGAPAGPAGTGKTETVKDLGKTIGTLVVVFNCSDQMDYKGLGKIFRGIAQSGCYGDFDEFNRIELDVMSVAAQQIGCILNAIKEKKKQFLYTDGCQVSLVLSAAYFITMNPGYAGRQELLENLKALFRSVAMICFKLSLEIHKEQLQNKNKEILTKQRKVANNVCLMQGVCFCLISIIYKYYHISQINNYFSCSKSQNRLRACPIQCCLGLRLLAQLQHLLAALGIFYIFISYLQCYFNSKYRQALQLCQKVLLFIYNYIEVGLLLNAQEILAINQSQTRYQCYQQHEFNLQFIANNLQNTNFLQILFKTHVVIFHIII